MPPPPGCTIVNCLKISIDSGVHEMPYDVIQNVTISGNRVKIVTNDPLISVTIHYTCPAMALDAYGSINSAINIWNQYGQ